MRRRDTGEQRRGSAIIEFAVILPVFVLLVMGMIEAGRAIMIKQIAVDASREGARWAARPIGSQSIISATVGAYLQNAGIDPNVATITMTPDGSSNIPEGSAVTVTVTIPYNSVKWPGPALFMGGRNIVAQTVMRRHAI